VWALLAAEGVATGEVVLGRPPTPGDVEPLTWALHEKGGALDVLSYRRSFATLQSVVRKVVGATMPYDALLTPALAERPVPIGTITGMERPDPLNALSRSDGFPPTPPSGTSPASRLVAAVSRRRWAAARRPTRGPSCRGNGSALPRRAARAGVSVETEALSDGDQPLGREASPDHYAFRESLDRRPVSPAEHYQCARRCGTTAFCTLWCMGLFPSIRRFGQKMRAFVFPGQGGGVAEPASEMVPGIRRVVGERIPDQVKIFARAAHDADESRALEVRPDVVAGHSLGEYGAAYAAGCFDFETGLWLVAQRDRFLAEAAEECPGGMVAILRTDPAEVEANYNSPRQTVVSGLRDAVGDAVSKIRGRKVPLNVSFAAHSPYVAAAGEKMRGVLDSVEFQMPQVPIVSAVNGAVLTSAEGVKEALKEQMVAPVRWVRVVETLAKMRVEEWVELGGGGVLTRMLRDFELPSLKGITFEDLRARLYDGAHNLLPRKEDE
jgi:[acyl-carrier-protein] S-malonyltransferase